MRPILSVVKRCHRRVAGAIGALRVDRRGATAVEYGLILALVVLGLMAGVMFLADGTTALWNMLHTSVANAR